MYINNCNSSIVSCSRSFTYYWDNFLHYYVLTWVWILSKLCHTSMCSEA